MVRAAAKVLVGLVIVLLVGVIGIGSTAARGAAALRDRTTTDMPDAVRVSDFLCKRVRAVGLRSGF